MGEADKNTSQTLSADKVIRIMRPTIHTVQEQLALAADGLSRQLTAAFHEGNTHRLLIKQCNGRVLFEVPLTFGILGAVCIAILAPSRWRVIGLILALFLRVYVVVEPYASVTPVTIEVQQAVSSSRGRRSQA